MAGFVGGRGHQCNGPVVAVRCGELVGHGVGAVGVDVEHAHPVPGRRAARAMPEPIPRAAPVTIIERPEGVSAEVISTELWVGGQSVPGLDGWEGLGSRLFSPLLDAAQPCRQPIERKGKRRDPGTAVQARASTDRPLDQHAHEVAAVGGVGVDVVGGVALVGGCGTDLRGGAHPRAVRRWPPQREQVKSRR